LLIGSPGSSADRCISLNASEKKPTGGDLYVAIVRRWLPRPNLGFVEGPLLG
jgi:hypothetical protein